MPFSSNLAYPPALEPLRKYQGKWVFHYPVFLNTYCLAFHLGRLLYKTRPSKDILLRSLLRQDHWSPEELLVASFKEKYQVELFIAGKELIHNLVDRDGECVRSIPFTSYQLRWVLLHREKARIQGTRYSDIKTYDELIDFINSGEVKKFYIVTDIRPTARAFEKHLRTKIRVPKIIFQIRDYWTREEGDIYDQTAKIYVFSAPLLTILRKYPTKYCEIDVSAFPPFETYVGAYIRPGARDTLVSDVTSSIAGYFQTVFDLADTATKFQSDEELPPWWNGASRCYSRAANSARQPDPFPTSKYSVLPTTPDDRDYSQILNWHHATPTTGSLQNSGDALA